MINTTLLISAVERTYNYYSYLYGQSRNSPALVAIEGEPSEWLTDTKPPNIEVTNLLQEIDKIAVNWPNRSLIWNNDMFGDVQFGKIETRYSEIFVDSYTVNYYTSTEVRLST